jgi:DNA-binding transcriptional LysR family regulator
VIACTLLHEPFVILRRLKYFVALAEELNFGRAARRLAISQSSLSQQIKALEEDLGVRLVERDRHHVRLTVAGTALLAQGAELLVAAERTIAGVREAATAEYISLGVGHGLRPAVDLAAFRAAYPGVRLVVFEASDSEIQRRLVLGTLTVGFFRAPLLHDAALQTRAAGRLAVVAYLPSAHPFASTDPLPLRRMKDEHWLLQPRAAAPALHDEIVSVLRQAGTGTSIEEMDVVTPDVVLWAVQSGLGVYAGAALPEDRDLLSLGIRVSHLPDSLRPVDVFVGWRRDSGTPLVGWFTSDRTS